MSSQTRQQQGTPRSSPNFSHSVNPVGEDGFVRCHHGEIVNKLVSRSDANPGREFYTCFKDRGDSEKCKFFKWADELPGSQATRAPAVTPGSPSKRPRETEGTPYTPNVSPSKAAANAATRRRTPTARAISNATDVDDIDDDDVVCVQSDEEISQFLGNYRSDPPAKKLKFQRTESNGETHTGGVNSTASSSKPVFGTSAVTSAAYASSPITTPVQKTRWQEIQDDPENPFHARSAALKTSITTPASPTKDAVSSEIMANVLAMLNPLPAAIERLERKLTAAELSRDRKAKRITELEDENQRLKNQMKALEGTVETLGALKARHSQNP